MEWFKDGERNTKFFHTMVKQRRIRLWINKIQNEEGEWVEGDNEIAEEVISFYQKQFTKEEKAEEFGI